MDNDLTGLNVRITETDYPVGCDTLRMRVFDIGAKHEIKPAAQEITGNTDDILKLYHELPELFHKVKPGFCRIPYSYLLNHAGRIYGDLSSPRGQDEFMDYDLEITTAINPPPKWAEKLWRFTQLKQAREFTHNSTLMGLSGVRILDNGRLRFIVRPSKFTEGYFTKGSEGVVLQITDAERERLTQKFGPAHCEEADLLCKELQSQYGQVTIREAIFKNLGRLPDFNENVYNHNFGVAGVVVTSDAHYIFVKRGMNVMVNQGINVTASGAVDFDETQLSKMGFQFHIGAEMNREAKGEIGLSSGGLIIGSMQKRIELEIGLAKWQYQIIPVGLARELPRGGSPEVMFLIKFDGTAEDLVRIIALNKHDEGAEIDRLVYAAKIAEVNRLLSNEKIGGVIQHKCLLNLAMIAEYLKNSQT